MNFNPIFLWMIFASLLLGLWGCQGENLPAAKGKLIKESIKVSIGTGGISTAGRWNLVRVEARAEKGLFRGIIRVQGKNTEHETNSRVFEVAHEAQVFELPILVRSTSRVDVSISSYSGIPIHSESLNVGPDPNELTTLVVHGQEVRKSNLEPLVPSWFKIQNGFNRTYKESDVLVSKLPQHWLGYDCIDTVILDGVTLLDASPLAQTALERWIKMGGVVIVMPGGKWATQLPKKALNLFGMVKQPEFNVIDNDNKNSENEDNQNGKTYTLTFSFHEQVIKDPILPVYMHNLGAGRVYILEGTVGKNFPSLVRSSDPSKEALNVNVWEAIYKDSMRRFYQRGHRSDLKFLEPRALGVLHSWTSFSYPEVASIATFILVYLGVGFCFVALILKRFHKMEWTYAVTIVFAIVSSFGIYRFGLLSAIKAQSVNTITVGEIWEDGRTATTTTFCGVESPRRTTLELDWDTTQGVEVLGSQPKTLSYGGVESPQQLPRTAIEYKFEQGQLKVPELSLLANSTRFFRLDGVTDLGDGISIERGNTLRIKNVKAPHIELWEIESRGFRKIKDLRRGEEFVDNQASYTDSFRSFERIPSEWDFEFAGESENFNSNRFRPNNFNQHDSNRYGTIQEGQQVILKRFDRKLFSYLGQKLENAGRKRFFVLKVIDQISSELQLGKKGNAASYLIYEYSNRLN